MEDIEHTLKEKLREIISDSCLKDPKVNVSEAVKGGYLGIPSKIVIEGQKNGQKENLHLFLKAAPKCKVTRETGCIRDVFLNEILMYTEIFPTLLEFQKRKAVSAPFSSIGKCFGVSVVDGHEFLIFEDLTCLGYALWDKTKPMTTDSVEYVFKETAKYHAMSFALQDQEPELFKTLVSKLNLDVMENICSNSTFMPLLTKSFENARKCFDPLKEYDILRKFDHFVENEVWNLLKCYPVPEEAIIIHGDSWCNNFMFHFDDMEERSKLLKMKFLDWQVARVGSPILDICYFFYANCSQEALENSGKYLRIYYECLVLSVQELGSDVGNIFPFVEFQKYWKKFAKFGVVLASLVFKACYGHADEIPEVKIEKADEFLDSITKSTPVGINVSKYKRRITGIMQHFIQNDLL